MSAISRFGKKQVIKSKVYGIVIRYDRDGTLRTSTPCKFCHRLSERYGVRWLVS